MKKSLAVALVSVFMLSASAGAIAANSTNSNSDNKVVTGCKKVGNAIAWPFKKTWSGMQAGWHKLSGK